VALALGLLVGCSSDEDSTTPTVPRRDTVPLAYENPIGIAVDAAHGRALVLHGREASSGPAIELVDIEDRSLVGSSILDYYDVWDVEFLSAGEGCFAGQPQGNIGYAVQFFSLPDLQLTTRVLTSTTIGGTHGYLAVDSAGGCVYTSHAGTPQGGAVFKVLVSSKSLADADDDGLAPFSLDDSLVQGLFNQPARVGFDGGAGKLVVGNRGDDFITIVDGSIWGTLHRGVGLTFPVPGTSHLSTVSGGLNGIRPEAMTGSDGIFVFAGTASSTPYLARFGSASNGLDFVESFPGVAWRFRNSDLVIHPRQDIFSVFVPQHDSTGYGMQAYRLNNLRPVEASPYHMLTMADSSISAVAVDVLHDRLVVGSSMEPRLELVDIR